MRLGLSLIFFGMFLIFLGTFLLMFEAVSQKSSRADVEYAGFVFLGPFPIGVASNKHLAYFALLFGFVFLFLTWLVLARLG